MTIARLIKHFPAFYGTENILHFQELAPVPLCKLRGTYPLIHTLSKFLKTLES